MTREVFLQQVRQALRENQRPGEAADIVPRGTIGYQGAGPDPVARFQAELTAIGGKVHLVESGEAAAAKVVELVQSQQSRRTIVGRSGVIDTLGLPERLRVVGVEARVVDTLEPDKSRDPLFAAEIGISGVDYLIAETGSVVVLANRSEPRSLSLLPPVHIAVAGQAQILPDLFDLFERFPQGKGLPSCLTVITGPSKTGDIELRLVTGVHGPGEIHVVLITA